MTTIREPIRDAANRIYKAMNASMLIQNRIIKIDDELIKEGYGYVHFGKSASRFAVAFSIEVRLVHLAIETLPQDEYFINHATNNIFFQDMIVATELMMKL